MSNKKQWPAADAMKVAEELQARLSPACERIAIAGSLRRSKPTVGDVEILFVPRLAKRPDGLFDEKIVSVASEACDQLLRDGILAKRPNVNGSFAWGEANKLAVHVASGIPVDLFATTAPCWYVALVIRTGSKDTNLRLTTGANKRNASLKAYGAGVEWSDGTVTQAESERHVFEMCGVPYLEPSRR